LSRWISWHTSLCATLRAACGRANRQSCRFVIARLAALIPRPGINLTRYRGVFAPNSPLRALVTPGRRGKRARAVGTPTEPEKRRAMTWAKRLKRVFNIDIERCVQCGGAVRIPRSCASMHVIACIQDQGVIRRFLII
jgi:hypothetical protein